MNLPLSDPQFWLVTGGVALVVVLAARKVRRALSSEANRPCASCPKSSGGPTLVGLGGKGSANRSQ